MSVIECGFLFVLCSSAGGGTRGLAHIRQLLGQRQYPQPGRGLFSTIFLLSVSRLSSRNSLSWHIFARGVYQPPPPPPPPPPTPHLPFLHHHSVPRVRLKSTQVMVWSFRHSTLWDTTAHSWCGRQMPLVPKRHMASTVGQPCLKITSGHQNVLPFEVEMSPLPVLFVCFNKATFLCLSCPPSFLSLTLCISMSPVLQNQVLTLRSCSSSKMSL